MHNDSLVTFPIWLNSNKLNWKLGTMFTKSSVRAIDRNCGTPELHLFVCNGTLFYQFKILHIAFNLFVLFICCHENSSRSRWFPCEAKLKIDNLISTFFRYLYRLQRSLNMVDFSKLNSFLKWLE